MTVLARKDAPLESTWKKDVVYASWDEWQAEYDQARSQLPELEKYSGRLKEGPAVLADWFELYQKHWERVMILTSFVRWASNVDSSDPDAKRLVGQASSLESQFRAAVSFMDPQLLQIGEKLHSWAEQEPRLKIYAHYFKNLLRLQKHQRSEEVEQLLSQAEEPFDGIYQAFSELSNTDLKFQPALDTLGEEHPLFQATITSSRNSPDRQRRQTSWENYHDGYLSMQNTMAALYLANVKQHDFLAKARNFDSVLEMRLSGNNLPVSVFHNLITVFKKNLPLWHRYWDVKRRVLRLEEINSFDRWAPILKNPPQVPYNQAVDWTCQALQPLGDEYVNIMHKGCLEERWVDWAPNIEKRQGAASNRKVGRKPPYIFMSYHGSISDLSTLAHELGHSMHSYYFDLHQPSVYNDYGALSSTVTETASNFNQAMTRAYLRQIKADDKDFQLAMIDEAMGNFLRYFFIMPTLARFEFEVFQRAQAGQPLSAKDLNHIMLELFNEGFGDTIAHNPDHTGITWATFLHLYMPFYTFQYAIGISAAHAAADKVLANEAGAAQDYLAFLKAGGSHYAIDLFKIAGVDMTTPAPIEKAFQELETNINLLEDLAG